MEIKQLDIVLCEFYFSSLNKTKKRPVLIFKDNLPYNDFVAIPISSKIKDLKEDEFLIDNSNFENGELPKKSKLMVRKTFVVSKDVVIKKYGTIANNFCKYFECNIRGNK